MYVQPCAVKSQAVIRSQISTHEGRVSDILPFGAAQSLESGANACCVLQVKPDGVQRGLIAEIIARFERKGYKLVAIKVGHQYASSATLMCSLALLGG